MVCRVTASSTSAWASFHSLIASVFSLLGVANLTSGRSCRNSGFQLDFRLGHFIGNLTEAKLWLAPTSFVVFNLSTTS